VTTFLAIIGALWIASWLFRIVLSGGNVITFVLTGKWS
jgi:hypothetical protein